MIDDVEDVHVPEVTDDHKDLENGEQELVN